jgi:general stress protein 26
MRSLAMEVASFADIEQEFNDRVNRVIWCNMSTVDLQQRPRSRVVHPVWEGSIGWLQTRRHSHKGKHLRANPYVSFAYVSDVAKPVYVDCKVEWVDDSAEKSRIWEFIKNLPPPMGFDPAPIYGSVDDPGFGLLKATPWRIELVTLPAGKPQIWHRE